MKVFLVNLVKFGICSVALFFILFFIERWILNGQGHFNLSKKDKYIFLGHSHAQMALNDSLIDSSLNLASAGEAYFYTYIKLNKILSDNKEKKVIFLEYSNNNIVSEMNNWIWDDVHIFDRYRLYSGYTKYDETKLLFRNNPKATLLCSIRSIVNNAYYIFNLKNIATDKKMGGYIYLVRDKTDSLLNAMKVDHTVVLTDTNISRANIEYLKKIIESCKKDGDRIFLIRVPLHPKYQRLGNELKFKEILNHELMGTELLDFKDFPLLDSDYGDLEHLNYRGAKKYSAFVNRLLEEGLLGKVDKQKFIDEKMPNADRSN